MDTVSIQPPENIGRNFIPAEYLGPDKDEYFIRNTQITRPLAAWRNLHADEVKRLIENGKGPP